MASTTPAAIALIFYASLSTAISTNATTITNETVFNATDVLGECGDAWIGTIVSAGLFIVSEALPFISKSPSNGILHTIINGLKGAQKK